MKLIHKKLNKHMNDALKKFAMQVETDFLNSFPPSLPPTKEEIEKYEAYEAEQKRIEYIKLKLLEKLTDEERLLVINAFDFQDHHECW